MKKIFAIILFIIVMIPAVLFAAGSSVTQTGTGYGYAQMSSSSGLSTFTMLLTSDNAAGTVTAALSSDNMEALLGKWIIMVECFPQGADAPTNLYDLTLTTTTGGLDIMGGALADRTSATTGDQALPAIGTSSGPRPITQNLTINGSNMGNSKKTKVIITLSR